MSLIIEIHCCPVNFSIVEFQPLGKAITHMDAGVEPTCIHVGQDSWEPWILRLHSET